MLKNYFKTAYRNLSRNRGYALLNIAGLAVGMAACLLIFLVIQYETSFDNFHPNRERIYRVSTRFNRAGDISYARGICFPAARQLRLDFPELQQVASVYGAQGGQLTVIDKNNRPSRKKFKEEGLFFTEPSFFSIFHFPFLAGNPATALADPNTVVLTQQAAEKYFGNWREAMGRTLQYQDGKICKITGVLKNIPDNTDFPLQVALSFKTLDNDTSQDWVSTLSDLNSFVLLPPGLSAERFGRALTSFSKKHIPADYTAKQEYVLQPLTEMHYDKRFGTYNSSGTFSKDLITAISLIGLFLLVIACINFINLATAQAVNRAREVGVRKALGGRKPQLVVQFLSESFILTMAAAAVALLAAFATLPALNQLLETKVALHLDTTIGIFFIALIAGVTLLSGLYPAFVLSAVNPIAALKSRFSTNRRSGISLRRGLVVLQFTVAQALMIATLIVLNQMNYFRTAPMGFDKDGIVNVPVPNDSLSRTKFNSLKAELLEQPGITNVSFSTFSISDNAHWNSDFVFNGAPKTTNFNADLKWADADVFKTYNLQMVAGRPYRPSDTVQEFVVNQTMVRMLGIPDPQDAVGKNISFWDGQLKGRVVGVVKDFNGNSLARPMAPMVMSTWKGVYQNIAVKMRPQEVQQTLSTIEKLWNAAYPESVYSYQFLDDKIASFYKQEDQLGRLYKIFAGIAIFISCLGLYGLVSFMAVQRTKETGIRKVLGASALQIVYLFSREFTLLIGFAFLIAAPVAFYFMHGWLQNFAFRITPGAGIFLVTLSASVTIAWLTAGYRALRAAMVNPVKSLRTE